VSLSRIRVRVAALIVAAPEVIVGTAVSLERSLHPMSGDGVSGDSYRPRSPPAALDERRL
jgi:hypothetical protein